jgi:hypothetical protein
VDVWPRDAHQGETLQLRHLCNQMHVLQLMSSNIISTGVGRVRKGKAAYGRSPKDIWPERMLPNGLKRNDVQNESKKYFCVTLGFSK